MDKRILILVLIVFSLQAFTQKIEEVIFTGNEGIEEETLRDIIISEEGDDFETKKISLDLRLIQNFYISNGYLFNSVAVDTIARGKNFVIRYRINEDRLITVGNVSLTGNFPTDRDRIQRDFGSRKGE